MDYSENRTLVQHDVVDTFLDAFIFERVSGTEISDLAKAAIFDEKFKT